MSAGYTSNFQGNKWLHEIANTTLFLACFIGDPTPAGNLTLEVLGGGYVRQPITLSDPAGKTVTNTNSIIIPGMPAVSIVALGVTDTKYGGHLLLCLLLDDPEVVAEGKQFLGAPGDWAFQLG